MKLYRKKMDWKELKTKLIPYFLLQLGSGCLKYYSVYSKSTVSI